MIRNIQSRNRICVAGQGATSGGFTLAEVTLTLFLITILAAGALGSIVTMHKVVRRQATYNSVLALMMSEHDTLRAQSYKPPLLPFTASTTTTTQTKSVSLDPGETVYLVSVTLVTRIEPVSSGHLVTVTASYTFQGKPVNLSAATLINRYSSVES